MPSRRSLVKSVDKKELQVNTYNNKKKVMTKYSASLPDVCFTKFHPLSLLHSPLLVGGVPLRHKDSERQQVSKSVVFKSLFRGNELRGCIFCSHSALVSQWSCVTRPITNTRLLSARQRQVCTSSVHADADPMPRIERMSDARPTK